MLFAGCASTALAQGAGPGSVTIPASSIVNPLDAGVRAHTNVQILLSPKDFTAANPNVRPQYYGPPYPGLFYEVPASIACVYNLVGALEPPGVAPECNPYKATVNPYLGEKGVAIVDAYDDPSAYNDLQTFSGQFGVAAINPTSFMVQYAPSGLTTAGSRPGSCAPGINGTAFGPKPAQDPTGGWELEESLDIEWAHAMAPVATLYLVESQSSSLPDLLCAVTTARDLLLQLTGFNANDGEISMSWGTPEFSAETSDDYVFAGVSYVVHFAAAGDTPGVSYPSASPYVVSVGGTSLSRYATGNFIEETTWQLAGGGQSAYEPRPHYQAGIANIVGSFRGTPDIAADANPYTGVWVWDSFMPSGAPPCGQNCWYVLGGTSVATPIWAGIVNAANTASSSSYSELNKLYADSASLFHDITLGNCGPYMGYFAIPGWDDCTGIGSPNTYAGK
jgi:subtilase family serine protease